MDLWCTLRHLLFTLMLQILIRYLKTARPLISNCLSMEVAAVAASNFTGQHGVQQKEWVKKNAGKVGLVNFSGDVH